MAASEHLVNGDESRKGGFWELNLLAIELEVLILISQDKWCDPKNIGKSMLRGGELEHT